MRLAQNTRASGATRVEYTDIFKEFCEIEGIDFESYSRDIEWLNPIHSQNYVRMEAAETWQ